MKTRTRKPLREESEQFEVPHGLDLEAMSDEELEGLLFEPDEEKSDGIWNLPTVAGLSLILVGVAYIFQELGLWNGIDISVLVNMLPWLAGILIILLGFGVLSWRPRKKKIKVRKGIEMPSGKQKVIVEQESQRTTRKKLTKSRNRKISGVAGGLAEYFNIDPTLVRIAFVIGTIASSGSFLMAYFILALIMPRPESPSNEERITIIRDS